ncbi:(3S,6E)-nerolidol synthase 1, chloroplastic-like [Neltuma alba]|uniref:(3S,6E)-nerolidol synthase 1, chloroplastic-like n=1 Tax=Neltuma alba TaxID=207710 RepID=UPI0010A459D8|nr:(3S,6E)-nerolidol synthase 1, chloroplastic-like [Prosopis alba]
MALFLRLLASAKRANPFSLQESTNLRRMPNHKWNIAQEDNLSYSASLAQSRLMTHNTAYMDDVHIKHARKLKEAKHVLMSKVTEEGREVFRMIDAIQRLGIEYLFEEEIEEALQKKSSMVSKLYCSSDRELLDVALQFRLLRQQGYFVHEDVFNTFMDKEGNLGENIRADIMGLLELHEASQLSVEDENNLDEAGEKSRNLLAAWLLSGNQDPRLAKHISGALQLPFHKSLPRFSHRRFCSNDFQFQVNKSWIHALQELANYDSCIVTSVHREEFVQMVEGPWTEQGVEACEG